MIKRIMILAAMMAVVIYTAVIANATDMMSVKAPAASKDRCSANVAFSPVLLFDNTGFRHSDGPVAETYGECNLVGGFYVGGYNAQSLTNSTRGNEWDALLMYRGKVANLFDYEARAHYYNFDVGAGTRLDEFGGRFTVSKGFDLAGGWKLTPMALIDINRITTIQKDVQGGAIGATLARKMTELPLAPMLSVNAKVWHYWETPAPNKGTPIGSVTTNLKFDIPGTKLTFGPTLLATFGDILGPDRHRSDYVVKFNIGGTF